MKRVLLCGYGEAGYKCLQYLLEKQFDHEIVLAVATHKCPLHVPSVEQFAVANELPINLKKTELHAFVSNFRPDIIFSVHYRYIIPQKILDFAQDGAYNFHPSLLPKHKGCKSGIWAIIENDSETGVTCHEMIQEVDCGMIILQKRIRIEKCDTGYSLFNKLVNLTCNMFKNVFDNYHAGIPFQRTAMSREGHSYHRRKLPFDGEIDITWSDDVIQRFIRALYFPPFPPAKIVIHNETQYVKNYGEYIALINDGTTHL